MNREDLLRIIAEMVLYAEINNGKKDIYPKELRSRINKALPEKPKD